MRICVNINLQWTKQNSKMFFVQQRHFLMRMFYCSCLKEAFKDN